MSYIPDDYITYEELVTEARDRTNDYILSEVKTQAVEIEMENKHAVFKAQVKMQSQSDPEDTELFTSYGDATTYNTGSNISKHFVRMAETRAIARALRLALGIGKTADLELEHAERDT